MKTLRIVQFAPFHEPVPPKTYGGIELIVYNLVVYLAKKGHKVTLVTAGTKARMLPKSVEVINVFPRPVREIMVQGNFPATASPSFTLTGIGEGIASLQGRPFDIIHGHLGWQLFPFKKLLSGVMVATLHGPLSPAYTSNQFFYKRYKNEPYISISYSQRAPIKLNFVGNAYNGIEVEQFTFNQKPQNYLAWLGRISPEKGIVEAIHAAKKAGERLVIAAKVDPHDRALWKRKVKPLIDGKQIIYRGEVDHRGKNALLQNAKALLALIQWDEPFGLFFIEALACGTPVIATPRGSVPEVLEDGKTGFYARNIPEAVDAIKKIDMIDRAYCRLYVKRRFSLEAMGEAYEKIYGELVSL